MWVLNQSWRSWLGSLEIDMKCEDDGGTNIGWQIGHYDENRVDGFDFSPFAEVFAGVETGTMGARCLLFVHLMQYNETVI